MKITLVWSREPSGRALRLNLPFKRPFSFCFYTQRYCCITSWFPKLWGRRVTITERVFLNRPSKKFVPFKKIITRYYRINFDSPKMLFIVDLSWMYSSMCVGVRVVTELKQSICNKVYSLIWQTELETMHYLISCLCLSGLLSPLTKLPLHHIGF